MTRIKALIPLFFLAAMAFVITMLRFHYITLPLDRDEGVYAYTAWRMEFREMPYRDILDHKPPMIYFFYSAALKLFGNNYASVRGFSSLYIILIMAAVFAAAWKMHGQRAAYISAVLYSVYQASVMMQGVNANTEIFLSLPLVLSVMAASGESPGKPAYFLSGLLFGMAFFTKEIVVFSGVFMLAYWILKKRKIGDYMFFVAGFLVFSLIILAWLMKNGLINGFIKYGIRGNFQYSGIFDGVSPLPLLLFLKENAFLVVASIYLAVNMKGKKEEQGSSQVILQLAALSLGIVLLLGRHTHYFLILYPFLCLASGCMLVNVWDSEKGKMKVFYVTVFSTLAVFSFGYENLSFYGKSNAEISMKQYREPYFYAASLVSEYINTSKTAGTTLFCWASEPEIYFQTLIKSPVRVINALPWFYKAGAAEIKEALNVINEKKPDLIAVEVRAKPELGDLLGSYNLSYSAGVIEVYALKK